MPVLTDRDLIRRQLRTDRIWSVYALGDLEPAAFAKSQWFSPGVTLVFRDFGACILFSTDAASVPEAIAHVDWPVYLQVRPDALAASEQLAVIGRKLPMWRMGWTGDRSGWVDTSHARRLTAADVPAITRLYADGDPHGEAPDFFFPSMVTDGVFYGVFHNSELLAAAGTHLYAPAEGAVAIGNVYTRRAARGRGLGRIVTNAVLRELSSLETIGLNVKAANAPAIRVYESLGFRKHCEFFEAVAERPLTTAAPR